MPAQQIGLIGIPKVAHAGPRLVVMFRSDWYRQE
jgi:hypothetical protein